MCHRLIAFLSLIAIFFAGQVCALGILQNIAIQSSPGKTGVFFDFDSRVNFQILSAGRDKDVLKIQFSPVNWSKSSLISAIKGGVVNSISYKLVEGENSQKINVKLYLKNGKYSVLAKNLSENLLENARQRIVVLIKNKNYNAEQKLISSKRADPFLVTKNLKRHSSKPNKSIVIAIDPGHGGKDSGAVGKGKIYEKNIVLSVSKQLASLINNTPGMKAVLTRSSDRYLSLRARLTKVRKGGADVFISIHADAAPNVRARGGSVYVLSTKGASSESAKLLARRENADLELGGH